MKLLVTRHSLCSLTVVIIKLLSVENCSQCSQSGDCHCYDHGWVVWGGGVVSGQWRRVSLTIKVWFSWCTHSQLMQTSLCCKITCKWVLCLHTSNMMISQYCQQSRIVSSCHHNLEQGGLFVHTISIFACLPLAPLSPVTRPLSSKCASQTLTKFQHHSTWSCRIQYFIILE